MTALWLIGWAFTFGLAGDDEDNIWATLICVLVLLFTWPFFLGAAVRGLSGGWRRWYREE